MQTPVIPALGWRQDHQIFKASLIYTHLVHGQPHYTKVPQKEINFKIGNKWNENKNGYGGSPSKSQHSMTQEDSKVEDSLGYQNGTLD